MRMIKKIKLIIEVDEKYYEACKEAVDEPYPSQIEKIIANGIPYEERPQDDIRWTDKVSVKSNGDIIDFEGRVVGHINL